jgi:very-short-patch-repair endonuclease
MDANKIHEQSAKHHANLHQGAKPSTHEHARELRLKLTEAEQKLWALLRNRQLMGHKFRRQHAIAEYVLDFYCHGSKLAIELDGTVHNSDEAKEYDNARTIFLNDTGIKVLRFRNEEVINDPAAVLHIIADHLA